MVDIMTYPCWDWSWYNVPNYCSLLLYEVIDLPGSNIPEMWRKLCDQCHIAAPTKSLVWQLCFHHVHTAGSNPTLGIKAAISRLFMMARGKEPRDYKEIRTTYNLLYRNTLMKNVGLNDVDYVTILDLKLQVYGHWLVHPQNQLHTVIYWCRTHLKSTCPHRRSY